MWPFKKKTFEERKKKLESLLSKHSKQWTHINYGQYLYKPVLSRAVSHILSINETRASNLIQVGKIQINGKVESDAQTRLESGKYVLFVEGHGYYEFFIK